MSEKTLLLYPEPRKIEVLGGKAKAPRPLKVSGADNASLAALFGEEASPSDAEHAWVKCETGAELPGGPEAYSLKISKDGVSIKAPSPQGALHALRTLKQLLRQFGDAPLPCLLVEDAPLFPVRGAMLDISRDRVPTMGTLFSMVDSLSEMKLNHLQLYTEHTFAYVGHEDVWRFASPMTPGEMRALDAYCKVRGVELCANQNCLGHMERWLKHPAYAQLGEMDRPYIRDSGWYNEPNTIDATNPASLALIEDLLGQLVPTCSGRYVNIGCDEPSDLGFGRSRRACEEKGLLKVYGAHVSRVARVVSDMGRRPQFWADPDFGNKKSDLPELPKDLIALVWGYEANMDFEKRTSSIVESGYEAWVAPGANGWNSFTGRTAVRRSNLSLAADTFKLGTRGFLNTEWGDLGHRQQWPVSLLGLAEGAFAAWTGRAPVSAKAAGLHLFGSQATGEFLEALGLVDDHVRTGNSNSSFRETTQSFFDKEGPGDIKQWRKAKELLDALRESQPSGPSLLARECRHAFETVEWAVDRAVVRRSPKHDRKDRIELAKRIVNLIHDYKGLWLARSRPGGLSDSVERYKRHIHEI